MMLDAFGERICIMGPSGSGKSTLAVAIGCALALPVIHLDQLHHQPRTNWRPRPAEEFAALHDAAIQGPRWVMEGNYSRLLPQRLARATGLILLDIPAPLSLYRYLRRCWFDRIRHGTLEGADDRANWLMIRHILGASRANRRRYRRMFDDLALPKLQLGSARAIDGFYRDNGLAR